MSDKISLTAELRTDVGKGASRRLRRAGEQVPAIIYGTEDAPQNLTLVVKELNKAMEQEAFYSQLLDVVIDGKATRAVVRDMQRNPANNRVTHIDFQRIDANKIMHVNVPIHFVNEEKCVGVKISGGTISHNMTEVEISCLPVDLPAFIEVNMEDVDLGFSVHLSGLALPLGVTVVALTHGEDHDLPVVAVVARRVGGDDLDDEAVDVDVDAAASEDAADSSDAGDDES